MKLFIIKKIQKINSKILLAIFSLLFILSALYYNNREYKLLISDFINYFNNYNFSYATNLLLYKQNYNPFKIIFIKKDLTIFLTDKLNNISQEIKNKSISDTEAMVYINEINKFNLISYSSINKVYLSIDSAQNSSISYSTGITYYNNNDYNNALTCFSKVHPLDINYENSLIYNSLCTSKLKNNVLNDCDNLIKNNYYTKAINLISDNAYLFTENDLQKQISSIKTKRQDYLNELSNTAEASSKAFSTSIVPSNINSLNITSNTNYLITVNISNQKTYIYKKNKSHWDLLKTFPCSTGIKSEATPCGSFTIKEKGEWFFSTKYNQGGKYWTQITGDILFHSLPYSKDQKTIVDYTLNTPSSHGCIRLNVNDAKWIYNNIPKDSKVIINN